MRAERRRQTILGLTRSFGGFASVSDLAELTGVSTLTIRRDAEELEAAGLVHRTRGAIRLTEGRGLRLEPSFLSRLAVHAEGKQAIARAAAARVRPHSTIAIDTGTTTLAFSQLLPLVDGLTVVTSSLVVASQAAEAHEVYVLAGRIRPDELSVVGSQAYASALDRPIDQLFLGAAAVGNEVWDYSTDDAYIKRAFIGRAEEVVLLCDASKFEQTAAAVVCDLASITTLITDAPPPADLARRLQDSSVEVVVTNRKERNQ
jgi:DeoR/GlpR family transcriptional regulator of sugar metabolism